MSSRRWWQRCHHLNVRGIYGDEIVSTIRALRTPMLARVRCVDCGRALYGRDLPDGSTRIYFDTEFIEDGRTIDLLSIGMVRADGATYYAEPAETDRDRASEWVQENVLPHLTGPVKPRAQIAAEVVAFAGESPEFWAWYADYDWVALCQLFGTMMDLPDGWPMFCRDLRQVTDGAALPTQDAQDGPEHHALSDARWLARAATTGPEGASA